MIQTLSIDEITARIEAALYSAGRPLSLDELVRASGSNSKQKTIKILNNLVELTRSMFRAIEICKLEDGSFVLQLKPEYTPIIRKYAQRPVMSTATLKTLSYVAYEEPITSKRLVQIRGSQVYTHLRDLEQTNFVEHDNIGRLKVYKTTKKFQEYFGVADLHSIRKKIGLSAAEEYRRDPSTSTAKP